MELWLGIALLLIGIGLAVYGLVVLTTGRVPARSRAVFRSVREAGMYPLCSGAALAFLALGQLVPDDWRHSTVLVLIATFGALTLVGIAYVLYRPRRQPPEQSNS
ncbi:hypothetical protein M1L60_39805 [Actinoplanes sp. TRM 88003]|uniref:Uncharacterized protein n=1 Tax=Paractinoplanes aksuensis TaxID=2939490 RepID=A0ABT1E0R6_9ACTN|nr:hypothetical protein [Actinoplanes aksuensis]MCO8276744.1 hypothetical protein [Actinoplanes aksuensis]